MHRLKTITNKMAKSDISKHEAYTNTYKIDSLEPDASTNKVKASFHLEDLKKDIGEQYALNKSNLSQSVVE